MELLRFGSTYKERIVEKNIAIMIKESSNKERYGGTLFQKQ